ncbi:short-chain dehydrogenase/reductase SDR [Gloeothece citriformis PCC 7424]|uniref:Short-chain dehydrogenase/reductase SDR n=1 Tax=Gloeothece citriformis (strain PCC 7424) TaxID=65393 RepID=B7KE94_GLOC7|nr:SDR family NAD(P)-dependent oxidoreductase [Gloeothece citriformis]ACK73212.1 short-chain dehydrogenase/reductase SDR [Gloeothece citriformis PCC 7424]
MTNLNQAVILLTGATGGFGQEFTRQLLKQNSRLILSDREENKLLEQTQNIQQEITTGEIIACLVADLSSPQGCQSLYNQVKTLNIPIDILINNAGIALYGRTDEVPTQKWEELMQINLLAPMRLTSLIIPDMITRQKGHIVNISSVAGWIALPGMTHYATSKYGLRGFSEGLAAETKAYNIKVSAVYPFFSRTPILQSPRYGTLAQEVQDISSDIATDPAQIIAQTLKGIRENRANIFPDAMGKRIQFLKRYSPDLLHWIVERISNKIKKHDYQ